MDDLVWRKASRSSEHGDECVELVGLLDGVVVRDSKDPEGPLLGFSRDAFGRLAREIQAGLYDG